MKKILLLSFFFLTGISFAQITVGDGTVTMITSDTTWSGDVEINGKIVVDANVTLTIEPGTVVKAVKQANPVNATALVVAKNGKIMANGTEALPIIFTMVADPLTASDVSGGSYFHTAGGTGLLDINGEWGGLIILGNNQIGNGSDNTEEIEGIASGQSWTQYGGSATNDNSGILNYVSIRHGGATIANGDEINGLTLGGVGNGTTITNIEIISNDDDGIELFGGNVDVTNLLIYNQSDDAIDIDEAYSGTITNSFVVMGTGGDNVFEIDGTESTSTPPYVASYTINGVTAIGNANAAQTDTYGHWKSDAKGSNNNIVFKDFKAGTTIEGIDADTFGDGSLTFSNIDFVTSDALSSITSDLTATHAEVVSTQQIGTGANTCVFNSWTAYGSLNANLCTSTSIGDGTVTMITSDTTWSGDVEINGKIVVDANVTLTIEPGTVVKAVKQANPVNATALVVAKNGKIMANGTEALPIIFTMVADPLTASDVSGGSYFHTAGGTGLLDINGEWGGLIILGNNQIGNGSDNTEEIEGIASGQSWTQYGGSATNDNSGILNYVSIRHGGATIANGDEINGLTLGGVGNGTTITNIEIISNDDDGIELFGGNVDVTNLLIYNQSDDAIDIDEAYSGTITNSFVVMGTGGDNVFEIDGTESTSTPPYVASYTINGVTAIGNANAAQTDTYGHWKSDAKGSNNNIVFKDFKAGTTIEGIDADTFGDGSLTFSEIYFVSSDALSSITSDLTATHAQVVGSHPIGKGSTEDHFYTWTAYFSSGVGTASVEEEVVESNFTVYPNPFTNFIKVSNETKVDKLRVYNTLGQLVKQNRDSNTINVSDLGTGLYLLEVISGSSRQVKKVIKR